MARWLQRFLDDLLWLLPLGAVLLLLQQYGRVMGEPLLAIIWGLLTLLIAGGGFLRTRLRRRAWLGAHVARSSPLQRWLRGGWLLFTTRLLIAPLLAGLLLVGTVRLHGPVEPLLLLAALPLLVTTLHGTQAALYRHVAPGYLPEAAWRVTLPLVFLLLCAGLTGAAFWRPGPDFTLVSLEHALWYSALEEQARSPVLQDLLQGAAALDGLRWWLAQQVLPRFEAPLVQGIGWGLVLLKSAVLVWAWLQCCTGILLLRRTGDARAEPDD